EEIDVYKLNFYSFYTPDKEKYFKDDSSVSTACDCVLCKRYSKAYLAHLFRIGDFTAGRLATIHNLRFYSLLMEKLQKSI
ncbi:MAG: Queuine tRNA-ribosyltransferase, partial [Candidatus Woesebacteria bacterium GW2011_GWD1_41_12]